ncbi:MAG: hypothetical protein JSS89_05970 [Bacteroidetes bacterium]|nr:hypothetical protein [Bacteroidota bacterium]
MKATLFVKRVACAYADHIVRTMRQQADQQADPRLRREALAALRSKAGSYLEHDLDAFLHASSLNSLRLPLQQNILQSLPPTVTNLIDLATMHPASFDTSNGQLSLIDSAATDAPHCIAHWESIVALRHVWSTDVSQNDREQVYKDLQAYCRAHPDLNAVLHELKPIAYAGSALLDADRSRLIPQEELNDFLMSDRLLMRYLEAVEHAFRSGVTLDAIIGSKVWQRILDHSLQREAMHDMTLVKDIPHARSIAVLRDLQFSKVVAGIVVERLQRLLEKNTENDLVMTADDFAKWLWDELHGASIAGPTLSLESLQKLCQLKKGELDLSIGNARAWPSLIYRVVCKTIGAAENHVRLCNHGVVIEPESYDKASALVMNQAPRPLIAGLIERLSRVSIVI